jgi:hypothetical protein
MFAAVCRRFDRELFHVIVAVVCSSPDDKAADATGSRKVNLEEVVV